MIWSPEKLWKGSNILVIWMSFLIILYYASIHKKKIPVKIGRTLNVAHRLNNTLEMYLWIYQQLNYREKEFQPHLSSN